MRADGMTYSRYIPVVPADLSGMERIEGGPHTDVVGVETKVEKATRGLLVSLRPPEWS